MNYYLRVESVLLRRVVNNCDLVINFTLRRDWLYTRHISYFNILRERLPFIPLVQPNLVVDSDAGEKSKIIIPADILKSKFAFRSIKEVVNTYLRKYNLKNDFKIVFLAGSGNILVNGVSHKEDNTCFTGDIDLITKETTFLKQDCVVVDTFR